MKTLQIENLNILKLGLHVSFGGDELQTMMAAIDEAIIAMGGTPAHSIFQK